MSPAACHGGEKVGSDKNSGPAQVFLINLRSGQEDFGQEKFSGF
jgi:hypothetical protein